MPTFCLSLALAVAAAADAGPTEFVVDTASGKSARGVVREIADGRSVLFEGGMPPRVDGDDLLSLRRAAVALPPTPTGPRLELAGGDVLPGDVVEIGRDRLTFRARTGPASKPVRLSLPLAAVNRIWLTATDDRAELRRQLRALAAEQRGQDAVWLHNGEHLLGTFTGLTDKTLRIEVDQKAAQVERGKVALVGFNPELTQAPTAKGPFGHVVLASGGRVSLTGFQLRNNTLTGKLLTGDDFAAPWEDVLAIDVRQGRSVYLSDLKPRSYKFTPFLPGLTYAWQADRTVDGDELALHGSVFDKGIGMHDASQLTFSAAGYRRFEAVVDLDAAAPPGACATVKVLVDGKASGGWEKELTAADGPQLVRLSVVDAKELTLVVDFAGRPGTARRPFVGGRVNWGDARLVK